MFEYIDWKFNTFFNFFNLKFNFKIAWYIKIIYRSLLTQKQINLVIKSHLISIFSQILIYKFTEIYKIYKA